MYNIMLCECGVLVFICGDEHSMASQEAWETAFKQGGETYSLIMETDLLPRWDGEQVSLVDYIACGRELTWQEHADLVAAEEQARRYQEVNRNIGHRDPTFVY